MLMCARCVSLLVASFLFVCSGRRVQTSFAFNPSGSGAHSLKSRPPSAHSIHSVLERQIGCAHRVPVIMSDDDGSPSVEGTVVQNTAIKDDPEVVVAEFEDVETDGMPAAAPENDGLEGSVQAKKQDLLIMGASTSRGEAASPAEKLDAQLAIEFLEQHRPATEIGEKCFGTWELVMSNTQLFRSSPFFMAGRAVCKDGEEAERYNWFCDMHRAALAISTIQRVRQIVSPFQIVSEFEVMAGAVPFVGDYFNVKYSGGLPFAITGSIVSTADIVSVEDNAWRLLMDTVEIKGSNIPALRQALDGGVKLETRRLGDVLEQTVPGYGNPNPAFRVTYVDDDMRISRDQDDNWFVYARSSDSQVPKDYSEEPADLGVGKLIDGLQRAFLAR